MGAWIVRYDLTDFEWSVIEPLLPMDRRGPKPKNNRQIINGMFYVLRAGSPWRDLPERYGPYTTVYNRFNRWRKAGVWDRLMDAIVKAHDGKVQMIDSSTVRVHQHASGVKKRVEFVVSVEAAAGSRRKSTRASTRRVDRSAS
jgi:transposase